MVYFFIMYFVVLATIVIHYYNNTYLDVMHYLSRKGIDNFVKLIEDLNSEESFNTWGVDATIDRTFKAESIATKYGWPEWY